MSSQVFAIATHFTELNINLLKRELNRGISWEDNACLKLFTCQLKALRRSKIGVGLFAPQWDKLAINATQLCSWGNCNNYSLVIWRNVEYLLKLYFEHDFTMLLGGIAVSYHLRILQSGSYCALILFIEPENSASTEMQTLLYI